MTDLKIDILRLGLGGHAGHAYRAGPVAARALALLADRLDAARPADATSLDDLSVAVAALDWGRVSDEQAARALADALFEALARKLGLPVNP
jgi:hypothetical protein